MKMIKGDYVQHKKTMRTYWVYQISVGKVLCMPDSNGPGRKVWLSKKNLEVV